MGYSTKGYTINYFINLFTDVTNSQLANNGVYSTVSPRKGVTSVRAAVLNDLLNGNTRNVVNGTGRFSSFGSTPRARILKALRLRKQRKL